MLTVYSKADCKFCDRAKTLLTMKNIPFKEVRVDQDPDARQLIISQGHRTVPQIYQNGQLVVEGGYQGLSQLSDIELEKLRNSYAS